MTDLQLIINKQVLETKTFDLNSKAMTTTGICLSSKEIWNAALLGMESSPLSTLAWIKGLGVAAVEQIAARQTHRLGHRSIHYTNL